MTENDVKEPAVEIPTSEEVCKVKVTYIDDKNTIVTKTKKGHKREHVYKTEIHEVKVTAQPKKCAKCNGTHQRGYIKTNRGNTFIPCSCLMRVMDTNHMI